MESIELSSTDLFELAPTFEKIRSRKLDRDELTESEQLAEPTESTINLRYIRRQVIIPDAVTIRAVLNESRPHLPNSVEPRRDLGITHISPSVLVNLYRNCFDSGVAYKDVRRFNKRINRIERLLNRKHTRVFAQLGAVSVFGNPHDPEKKKYIGAEIVKESDEGILDAENEYCLGVLTEGNQEMRSRYYDGRKPHLSLACTYSYMDALHAVDYLNQVKPLKDKWIALGQAYTPKQPLHVFKNSQDN